MFCIRQNQKESSRKQNYVHTYLSLNGFEYKVLRDSGIPLLSDRALKNTILILLRHSSISLSVAQRQISTYNSGTLVGN